MTERAQILALNAFDAADARGLGPKLAQSVRQRANLFGAASVLFYDKPLNFVRGKGCFLYDADGTAYLDAYNNVPSVGHCHPQVAEAAARQLGELNIHNRYLHQGADQCSIAGRIPAQCHAGNQVITCIRRAALLQSPHRAQPAGLRDPFALG